MYKPYLLVILFLIIVCPFTANAENRAVSSFNYSIGASWSSNEDYNSYGGNMAFSFPLAKYLGTNLGISATRVDNSIDSETYRVTGGIFLRDFDLGLVEMSVTYLEGRGENVPDSSVQNYTFRGAWYLKNTTLGVTVSHAESNDSQFAILNDYNGATSLKYYINESLSSSFFIGFLDYKENYSLSARYQPNILGNKVALGSSISFDKNDDISYSASLTYYFGETKSLIDRDRKD